MSANPSDHFNGKTFFNPGAERATGLKELIRWRFTRQPTDWGPPQIERDVATAPADLILSGPPPKSVEDDRLRVTFIGHATVLLQTRGLNVLTDPIWSERCSPVSWAGPKRYSPPGVSLADLPRIDVVLVSHNHYDHLDVPTLKALEKRFKPRFVTGLGNKQFLLQKGLSQVEECDWWDELDLAPKVRLVCTPAQHFSARGIHDRNATLWAGFALRTPEGPVYFAGDTGYAPFFKELRSRLGPMRFSLLPIGAYEPRWFMKTVHMNPEDAVQAHFDLESKKSLGMHFGAFPLADEGRLAPLRDLARNLKARGVRNDQFVTVNPGEAIELSP